MTFAEFNREFQKHFEDMSVEDLTKMLNELQ